MRQDERARQPLDTLQRDGALAAQFFAPSFPPCQNLGMAGFGLGETPFRAGDVVVQLFLGAVDLVQSLDTDLVEERRQSVFVEPGGGFREGCDIGQRGRRDRGTQVAEQNQTVQPLPVAMDAAHSLFQAIRVPRDVVVEQDVAALQVDALTGRFGGHQHLDRALAELLLGVEPGARFVARAGLHPAVNAADPEAALMPGAASIR